MTTNTEMRRISASPPPEEVLPAVPPYDRQAEEALLGALLIEPENFQTVAAFLSASDFYIHRNGWIFSALKELVERHVPIDVMTLASELENQGRLAEAGGSAYLAQLLANVPSSSMPKATHEWSSASCPRGGLSRSRALSRGLPTAPVALLSWPWAKCATSWPFWSLPRGPGSGNNGRRLNSAPRSCLRRRGWSTAFSSTAGSPLSWGRLARARRTSPLTQPLGSLREQRPAGEPPRRVTSSMLALTCHGAPFSADLPSCARDAGSNRPQTASCSISRLWIWAERRAPSRSCVWPARSRPDFVVLDALYCFMPGLDENAAGDMGLVMGHLREVARETGAAVLLLHHANKNDLASLANRVRGSSALSAAIDVGLMVAIAGNGDSMVRTFSIFKNREAPETASASFSIEGGESGGLVLAFAQRTGSLVSDTLAETAVGMLLTALRDADGPLTRKALEEAARAQGFVGSPRTADTAFQLLQRMPEVRVVKMGRVNLYSWARS